MSQVTTRTALQEEQRRLLRPRARRRGGRRGYGRAPARAARASEEAWSRPRVKPELPRPDPASSIAAMSEAWPHKDDSGLPSWWERCLALMPPSVDLTQIDEDLRLTPTQRIEK